MINRNFYRVVISIFAIFLLCGVSYAIEISPDYSEIQPGQVVNLTIKANFPFPPISVLSPAISCQMDINYGDGTGWHIIGTCKEFLCRLSASHRFVSPGDYVVTVRSSPRKCNKRPYGPDPATARVRVNCPPMSFQSVSPLPSGQVDKYYNTKLIVKGGALPLSFRVIGGLFPPGLELTSDGYIRGTPVKSGTYTFTIEVTDSCFLNPQRVKKSFSIDILETCKPLSFLTPEKLPLGKVGSPYSEKIIMTGGVPPIKFAIVSGFLPPGLRISSDGLINGIPEKSGQYRFMVEAVDSCPYGIQRVRKSFIIDVQETCEVLEFVSPFNLSSGTVGYPYNERIIVRGGKPPLKFKLLSGSLPPGVLLNRDGSITGVCGRAGIYLFTIEVSDSCPSGVQRKSRQFRIKVNEKGFNVRVSIRPSVIKIPRHSRFTQSLVYSFTVESKESIVMESSAGVFWGGGRVLGTVYNKLRVGIVNGTGMITELLTVPPSISMRAEELGLYKVEYVRDFIGGDQVVRSTVVIYFTTEASGQFRITRVRLFFENNRPEITVKRNAPSPKVFAEINYTGSGLLEAYWEVDGRILQRVFRHLSYGERTVIKISSVPPLPTFMVGTHVVRFVIVRPYQVMKYPQAIYFVSAAQYAEYSYIKLLKPIEGTEINQDELYFSWRSSEKEFISAYVIEFFKASENKAFFSAFVRNPSYRIPPKLVLKVFSPGHEYRWKVQGLDNEGEVLAESEYGTFIVASRPKYVANQIMIMSSEKQFPYVTKILESKFNLRLLYSYCLEILDKVVAIFHTNKDVMRRIAEIRSYYKDKDIIVQPNFIYRTSHQNFEDIQLEYKMLNLALIHKKWRGRGVRIAIVDSGVDVNHLDLKSSIKQAENFIEKDNYKPEIHGTAVAGLICADKNEIGITGVAPEAEIIAMRACKQVKDNSSEAECYSSSVAKAVDKAVSEGARIVNMSFGSEAVDPILEKLITKARIAKNVLFVASAGNCYYMRRMNFPASHPYVISVAGFDQRGKMYPNEDIAKRVDVVAPCENIITTFPRGSYNFISGTSFSSAIVSGLLALGIEKDGEVNVRKIIKTFKKPINVITLEQRLLNARRENVTISVNFD